MPEPSGRPILLIAGPLALVADGERAGDIAGAGAIAAIAAAALVDVQLWARGGAQVEQRVRDVLARRRIELAGVEWTGATPREAADGVVSSEPFLPELTPTSGDDVGAALVAGLSGAELVRAVRAIKALPRGDTRPLLVWQRDAADGARDRAALRDVDIWIAPAAGDALAQARDAQREGGPKCAIATAGGLGGLIAYGDKATTYPALPERPTATAPGAGAAFAGVLAAWCAQKGKADFSAIKRGAAMASAVAGAIRLGPPSRKLLAFAAKEYTERFNKLRRVGKF